MQGRSEATDGQTDGTTRFNASDRCRTRYPKVSQGVRHVVEPGRTMRRHFENAKIEDISECRATVRRRMVKRMVRRDSGHRIGL